MEKELLELLTYCLIKKGFDKTQATLIASILITYVDNMTFEEQMNFLMTGSLEQKIKDRQGEI